MSGMERVVREMMAARQRHGGCDCFGFEFQDPDDDRNDACVCGHGFDEHASTMTRGCNVGWTDA